MNNILDEKVKLYEKQLKEMAVERRKAISNLNNQCDAFAEHFLKVYFLKDNESLNNWLSTMSNILDIINNTLVKGNKKLSSNEVYKQFFTYSVNEEAEVEILIDKVELSGIKLPVITDVDKTLFLKSYKEFARDYSDTLSSFNKLTRDDWKFLLKKHFKLEEK